MISKTKNYIIVLRGCDDINKSLICFSNEKEKNNFIFYARHLNSKSECCCQPTIHLYELNSNLFKILDIWNLYDFVDLDLIGGVSR